MNLQTKDYERRIKLKGVKRFKKYAFRALICIVVILLIGFSYEKIGEYNDAKKYSPVGKMVTVNNHKINVYIKGKGNVTVVFSAGLSTPSAYADMYPLYNEISKYTKTIVYDRPGHGWSEVTDVPRDIDSITEEMHTALIKSGQKSPYILVGHSFASLPLIRFTQIYKNEVSGLVLIDGGAPEYYTKDGLLFPKKTVSKYKLLKSTGLARLVLYHTDYFLKNLKLLPDNLKQLYLGMTLKTMYNKNIIAEGNMSGADAKTVLVNGHLGNVPLRIFTSESSSLDAEWENSQEALKKWSTNSMQIVVKGSTHAIHHTSPGFINNEIKKLIKNQK
ncbi:alpha/beta hydrolase [Clostridium estertheticum]|uniref:alpha/beta hydrolase n=1 Tax=Clostridium estertheticum TaxID=238834 RepID=UPI001C0C393C|nr:alpha/beta hydrolase [Clostridium estertheticum]MBU3174610.1 alpha/beta hydrolase [Clostridium estertheticum]